LGVPIDAREDVVQEVMLVVHRRLDQFEWRSSVRTWLFGILYNVVANYRRSQRRKGPSLEIPAETPSREADPQSAAIGREDLRFVQTFLEGLADEPRGVFVAFFLERLSAPETAQATGLGIDSVYACVRTLKRRFQAELKRREEPR
jgi:RNA polymerase sigma-70 factor (ECF subfamily)